MTFAQHDTVVFLGPSLERDTAIGILGGCYLPPAEQGSVVNAVQMYDPRTIVLIDGSFASVPAVRHKELLWAISKGVQVIGAASIGALRAAELHEFGMTGYGFIYRWYRATIGADDDEVAVAMSPIEIGAQPLTEALIDIRLTLRFAARMGVICEDTHKSLIRIARAMDFRDRTYSTILEAAKTELPANSRESLSRLAEWIVDHAINQKASDAKGLLSALSNKDTKIVLKSTSQPFRMTDAWLADLEIAGLRLGN
ncbi:TfuA-like protein [Microvirga sesbaniae]|uniref:TfuA-like protein n=1 Tax=Microvirga sesbaniae TaxID=681392 RepID=UPI0021C6A1D5|nr:TfuA-like protein [Microvirga sp. HBU67692]